LSTYEDFVLGSVIDLIFFNFNSFGGAFDFLEMALTKLLLDFVGLDAFFFNDYGNFFFFNPVVFEMALTKLLLDFVGLEALFFFNDFVNFFFFNPVVFEIALTKLLFDFVGLSGSISLNLEVFYFLRACVFETLLTLLRLDLVGLKIFFFIVFDLGVFETLLMKLLLDFRDGLLTFIVFDYFNFMGFLAT